MPPTIITTTDTPRTDACPHCGAGKLDYTNYICGTTYSIESRGNLCLEREKSKKLEVEVESYKKLAIELVQELISKCDNPIHKEQLKELTK
jgi:hypothetical protein